MKLNSLVDGVMGADASPVEKFSINAPVFKKDKIATIQDYRPIPLGDGYNFIDDLTAIDASQKTTDYGVQINEITMYETGLAYGDDAVRFNMTLTLPASILSKGKQVLQYVELVDLYSPDEPGIGMTCRVTVDNATDVTINSFEGAGSLKHKDSKDLTVNQQRSSDKQSGGEENFGFSIHGRNKKDYETRTEYNGYKTVTCMADLALIKGSDDMEKVYRTWQVTTGARIYDSKTATTFKEIPEFVEVFALGAVEEEWFDPALLEEFDEVFDDLDLDDIDFDFDVEDIINLPIPEEKATMTISGSKYNGAATMSMKGKYENIPKIDLPDQIVFIFEADIPKDALAPGKVIVQSANLVGKTTSAIEIGIQCKVQVGNADATETRAFKGGAFNPVAGKDWFEVNFDKEDYT